MMVQTIFIINVKLEKYFILWEKKYIATFKTV